jgi:hypothetical protein
MATHLTAPIKTFDAPRGDTAGGETTMTNDNHNQATLPIDTTPTTKSARVAVLLDRGVLDRVSKYNDASFTEAVEHLLCFACDAIDLARKAAAVEAPKAAAVEAPMRARANDALIGEIAAKIAAHVSACDAGFWTGGVPEARALLGLAAAHGHTISAAYQRIEHGKVPGFAATQCGGSHRARGTFALWTVTVAQKKLAT